MRPAAGVELLDLGGRCALFHEGRQELVELNETARHIWQGLANGQTPAGVAASLASQGAAPDAAASYVDAALHPWLRDGWIIPAAVDASLAGDPHTGLTLSILDIGFAVDVFGAPPKGLLDILEPMQSGGPVRHRLSIVPWGEQYFLFVGAMSRGLHAAHELAPAVKAALTERLVASVADGFVAHGGLVSLSSRRMFLSGGPGAGKSTLTLALGHGGFDCLSDDIVHVDDRGWMKGAPFAPTLKTGAWPLLAGRVDSLEALPVHRRADGQDVRYAPAALSAGEARPLDHFIVLSRQADGPAELEAMPALEAMRILLEGAFASAGRISAGQVTGLAKAFESTDCYVLRYAGLQGAVDVLHGLADE